MYQRDKKLEEALRDLEKAVVLGILSGNTIGTSSNRRTLQGLRSFISTNAQSVGAALTESWLGTAIGAAWSQGGTDCNLLYCGVNYKRIIDTFNATRKLIPNEDRRYINAVSEYESTFGTFTVMLSRWMPSSELLVLATPRISVVPLRGRSFQFKEVVSQGDSRKGFVLGEYTLEARNADLGMARIF